MVVARIERSVAEDGGDSNRGGPPREAPRGAAPGAVPRWRARGLLRLPDEDRRTSVRTIIPPPSVAEPLCREGERVEYMLTLEVPDRGPGELRAAEPAGDEDESQRVIVLHAPEGAGQAASLAGGELVLRATRLLV